MVKWKVLLVVVFGVLVLGAGIRLQQPLLIAVSLAWVAIEFLIREKRPVMVRHTLTAVSSLLSLYSRGDETAETLLYQKIHDLKVDGLTDAETRWVERLKDLFELRRLVFGKPLKGRRALRQAIAYATNGVSARDRVFFDTKDISEQDIMEAATVVADLYWKLYEAAIGLLPDLQDLARQLSVEIFDEPFDKERTKQRIEKLTDSMQKDGGSPFLVLNFLRHNEIAMARALTQAFLTESATSDMDEDVRSVLYWITELRWFTQSDEQPITDFDSTVRYLYHLCFTNPERAGFLEIDSQFFSQFETVNELAREGFLFKETLVDKTLGFWKRYEGLFDSVFQAPLEALTQRKSKIYDEVDTWERYWKLERNEFSRDYLYVVEGNLFYAGGHFEDACTYYEKALKLNPTLRSAMLNLIFCYAKLKKWEHHAMALEKAMNTPALFPSYLYVAGNSYLLLGELEKAEEFYSALRGVEGWERKVEYYISTFCFENGLFDSALHYAKLAHEQSPHDTSINYHLSLCHNSCGNKDEALTMLRAVNVADGNGPELQWLNYYRFTLERDSGRHDDASETLLKIPSDYFQDADELEAALTFAKQQKDLVLLRHLRSFPKP